MAFDGSAWNESSPTNSDLANEIDDYMRDIKIGVRSRMENEHVWSSSQTATGSDGQHKFITLKAQTSTPSLVYGTSTQAACIFADTDNAVKVVDKTGVAYTIVKSNGGLVLANGTGTAGALPYITSGGTTVLLAAGTSGYYLQSAGAAAPTWAPGPFATFPTGITRSSATLFGNGSYTSSGAEYFYLTIGRDSTGGLQIVSGSTASGVAVPLPAGCTQANCNWIIAPACINGTDHTMSAFELSIDASRVVTVRARDNNWV